MTWLIQMSVTSSITAILILAIKTLLKDKISAKWQVYIWAILLVRLLMPVLPESPVSVFNRLPVGYVQTEQTHLTVPVHSEMQPSGNLSDQGAEQMQPAQAALPAKTAPMALSLSAILFYGWLAISILLFIYFISVYLAFSRRVGKMEANTEPDVLCLLEDCKRKLNVSGMIRVATGGDTPVLKGIWKPVIVVPKGYSLSETKDIFIHELCHYKHGDVLILWVATALLCLNWFNPVMWYCFFRFRKDIELACDGRVLEVVEDRKEYAALLLKTALKQNRFLLGTTAMQNGEKEIARRIKTIAYFKKPKVYWSLIALAAAVLVGGLCLTNAVVDWQEFSDGSFTVRMPKDITHRLTADSNVELTDAKGTTVIGSITPHTRYPAMDNGKLYALYGQGEEIINEPVNDLTYTAYYVELKRGDNAETERHIYILTGEQQKDANGLQMDLVYDLKFSASKITKDTALKIARTFQYINPALQKWQELLNNRDTAMTDPEQRISLFESLPQPDSAEDSAKLWAISVSQRNGVAQYVLMDQDLRKQFFNQMQELNWVTGTSSPCQDGFSINKTGEQNGQYLYEVTYRLMTSAGPAGTQTDKLTIVKEGDSYRIANTETTYGANKAVTLPASILGSLSEKGISPVNQDQVYRKTVVLKDNIIYQDPETGVQINGELVAQKYGYNMQDYYGKEIELYIYDTANDKEPASSKKYIFLSALCDGKEIITYPIQDDWQKQKIIDYIAQNIN